MTPSSRSFDPVSASDGLGRHAALAALALLATLGCGDSADPAEDSLAARSGDVILDLVADLSLADVLEEPGRADLGTPAARPLLAEGFSWDERSDDGRTFVWSSRASSTLELFSSNGREATLRFEALPWPDPEGRSQVLTLALNRGRPWQLALEPGWNQYEVPLSGPDLRAGINHLEISYAYTRGPDGGGDGRALAVAWDWLELGGASGLPEAIEDGIRLPVGTGLDYYLPTSQGLVIEVDRVRTEAPAVFEVWSKLDGAPPNLELSVDERMARSGQGRRGWSATLPSSPAPLRVSLRASALDGEGERVPVKVGGVRVVGPWAAEPELGEGRPEPALRDERDRPNLLVVLVDTLRADHLGLYGYDRPTSPRLDALAAEAVVFENAIAQSSWTKPAVATLLTGLSPLAHGVNSPEAGLPDTAPRLAESLAGAGYRTAAVVTNAHLGEGSGFAAGFERYDFLPDAPNDAPEAVGRALSWLAEHDGSKPFFLYLHLIDPHAPYAPSEEARRRFARAEQARGLGSVSFLRRLAAREIEPSQEVTRGLIDLYDAEIADTDRHLGVLWDELERRGLLRDTLLVFVSDHGEAFGDHGVFGHGWDLHQEVLRVPLFIRPPGGGAGRREASPVSQMDVTATLLGAAGLAPLPGSAGRDLLALDGASRPAIVSYLDYEERRGASLVEDGWKLVLPLSGQFGLRPRLFPLSEPEEGQDYLRVHPVRTGLLESRLRATLDAAGDTEAPEIELDEATRRRLEALGYLN